MRAGATPSSSVPASASRRRLAVLVFLGAPGGTVAILALAGLLAYEHAFVQAGQAVPLA